MKPERDSQTRILVVDDVTNMRRTIRNMLKLMGFVNVMEAADGGAALVRLRAERFDLVITDWNMPKMSGLELLERIRADAEMASTPVLMVTAEPGDSHVAVAAERSVDGYIIKPFEMPTFQKKVTELLERRLRPGFVEQGLAAGRGFADAGRFDLALDEYAKILEKNPRSARALTASADAWDKMGDHLKAEEFYRKANEANPLFVKAWVALANLLARRGDKTGELAALEKANTISPFDASRQAAAGRLHLLAGNIEKAKAAFSMAMKRSEENAHVAAEIGEAFLEAGLDDLAAGAFRQALKIDPANLHVYNRLGIALRRKGAYLEAVDEYKKALSVAPNDEAIYFNMAKAFLEARHYDDATGMVDRALKIDPDFKEAKELRKEIEASRWRY